MTQLPVVEPRVAIYARVADLTSEGLTQQEGRLRSFAADRGWRATDVLVETRGWGISDEMLDALARYDQVLVQDLSRLSRSPHRLVGILRRLEESGVRVFAADEVGAVSGGVCRPSSVAGAKATSAGGAVDFASVAAGFVMLTMMLAEESRRARRGDQR